MELLTRRLDLKEPEFYLETLPSGKVAGNVVSDSFRGMDDLERQRRIWNALDEEFEGEATGNVSTLLAYTKDEWYVNLADA